MRIIKKMMIKNNQRGATTIFLSFFVMNILLMMALTAASIMIYQLQMSKEVSNSVPAFYAADAITEECLYQVRRLEPNSGNDCTTVGATAIQAVLDNGASGEASLTAINQIKTFGVFGGTQRNIELVW